MGIVLAGYKRVLMYNSKLALIVWDLSILITFYSCFYCLSSKFLLAPYTSKADSIAKGGDDVENLF